MSGTELFAIFVRNVEGERVGVSAEAFFGKTETLAVGRVEIDGNLFTTLTACVEIAEDVASCESEGNIWHKFAEH